MVWNKNIIYSFIPGNLTYIKGEFYLINSNVGEFSTVALDDILNLLFTNGILPAVNEELRSGIPLPAIPGVTFTDPSLGKD